MWLCMLGSLFPSNLSSPHPHPYAPPAHATADCQSRHEHHAVTCHSGMLCRSGVWSLRHCRCSLLPQRSAERRCWPAGTQSCCVMGATAARPCTPSVMASAVSRPAHGCVMRARPASAPRLATAPYAPALAGSCARCGGSHSGWEVPVSTCLAGSAQACLP